MPPFGNTGSATAPEAVSGGRLASGFLTSRRSRGWVRRPWSPSCVRVARGQRDQAALRRRPAGGRWRASTVVPRALAIERSESRCPRRSPFSSRHTVCLDRPEARASSLVDIPAAMRAARIAFPALVLVSRIGVSLRARVPVCQRWSMHFGNASSPIGSGDVPQRKPRPCDHGTRRGRKR